jgi:hypothetical protein
MPLAATVVIPTFDHGPTVRLAVASVLAQTVEDFELFLVGDGVPDVTREIAAELGADPRFRFFDNPKGPRHGEIHRHAALGEARGQIVCYLSDDDLWLPDHLEVMAGLLEVADFAHTLPVRVETDGRLGAWVVDLEVQADRELLLGGENRIPLSCSGHTMAAYRSLPHGWRTTPNGVPTDLYMFQQFLAEPWVRALSGTRATYLHFASPARVGWSLDERVAEMLAWADRSGDERWRGEVLPSIVPEALLRNWAATDRRRRLLQEEHAACRARVFLL